ncbi:ABC transporter permease [Nocardioides cremeus]|jgi:peptide/nickel transport system permease protein|uniref:ABC transporter permease n=1 Tax=Nocardioides cremeus TaxID=3058044 RepID=A0ABT8TQP3_9ACTN|nr:ABC transporter permease [Nocardioides cremeus]MDO3396280.1 ABC transporter permease [Nocardioides cremeus]
MRRSLRTIWQTRGLARYLLVAGVVMTAAFVVLAVFAPWIAPYDFAQNTTDAGERLPKLAPPSGEHWLGTNDQFYDIWSRVVWGARTALQVVLLSVFLSALVGVPLGLLSGFTGGWPDRVMVFLMDALYSFPSLLLAIVFSFLLRSAVGGGVLAAALALTAVYIPQYFRVVRNTTVSAREATYVEAARALGARPFTIMRKYLFGNVVQSVPVIGTLNAADALGTLAALGFLGLGIQPTEAAEWGYDLSRALDDTSAGVWWPALFPGLAIILLITALTLVGEGLNETLNPALRRRRLQPVRFTALAREGGAR